MDPVQRRRPFEQLGLDLLRHEGTEDQKGWIGELAVCLIGLEDPVHQAVPVAAAGGDQDVGSSPKTGAGP